MQKITKFIEKTLPTLRIAVVGDVMLDRYVFGEVERISPEAPVPINRVCRQKSTLGGAANVASNLANLDCQVFLSGLVGHDSNKDLLLELLKKENINAAGIVTDKSRETTTKMRVLGARQQMLRLDFEETGPIELAESKKMLHWLETLCQQGLSGIAISDYGKGVCTIEHTQAIISLARKYGVVTIVDPKGANWEKYRGADFITPNVKELSECVGYKVPNEHKDITEAANLVLARYDIKQLVVTRSEQGITLVNQEGTAWHDPATQQEVFDVSGAGDTVVAMLITAITGGLSHKEMLQLANEAAGVVVSKIGTYPIHRHELRELRNTVQKKRVRKMESSSQETLREKVKSWHENGKTVVFTNGCFDLLHRGHLQYLRQAAELGDYLIIGLNSDLSVRKLKGESRPIINELDRAFLLKSLTFVDDVIIFSEETPYEVIKALKPDILVKGGDYKAEEVVGADLVSDVVILPFEEGYSTTSLLTKIKELIKEGKL